jgi:hypothetical protein
MTSAKVNLELLIAEFVRDAIEPGLDTQTIELPPLWEETKRELKLDEGVRLNVFSVLGHLRALDREREYTYAKSDKDNMILVVTRVIK